MFGVPNEALVPLRELRARNRALKRLAAVGVAGLRAEPDEPSNLDTARTILDPHGNGVRIGESDTPAPGDTPSPGTTDFAHRASAQAAEDAAFVAVDAAAVAAGCKSKRPTFRRHAQPPATLGANGHFGEAKAAL